MKNHGDRVLYHGRPGSEYDASFWEALHTLQDRIWPELSARIEVARMLGVHWEQETTPFAWFEDGRALAHVGVIAHPLRLIGQEMRLGVREIYVHYGAGMGTSKLTIPAAKSGTARNINTITKLAEMAAKS